MGWSKLSSGVTLLAVGIAACGGAPSRSPATPSGVPAQPPAARATTTATPEAKTRGLEEVDVAGAGEGALDLRFQIRAHHGNERRYIAPGASLETGDRIEMFIELDQPAHVYVVQFFADESTAVLFPRGDASARLEPGRHRIPPVGKMFQLDESTGDEHVYVVASRQPLEQVDREIADSVDEVRISGAPSRSRDTEKSKPKAKKKKKKPKLLSLGNRGLSRVSGSSESAAVSARADTEGVVVFRFWFVHR